MNCERVEREGLLELYLADRLDESDREAFEAHFFECPRCFQGLEDARRIRAGFGEMAPSVRSQARRCPGVAATLLATAAVLVLIALAALLSREPDPDSELVALGRVRAADLPPYVPVRLRGEIEATEAHARGLDAYRRGDFDAAAAILEPITGADASPILHLYTGASLLASERPEAAMPHLEAAGVQPMLADTALWLIARAHLQQGDAESALEALRRLSVGDGPWAERALELRSRVEAEVAGMR